MGRLEVQKFHLKLGWVEISPPCVYRTGRIYAYDSSERPAGDAPKQGHHQNLQWLILNGQPVESDVAYRTIYEQAQSSIYVIDNYIGLKTLVLLKDVVAKVDVTIFSDNLGKGLHKAEFDDFCAEYGRVQLKKAGNMFHDRYIVLDYDKATEKIYHCGASSKDGGNRVMTIEEVSETAIYHPLILKLLSCSQLVLN